MQPSDCRHATDQTAPCKAALRPDNLRCSYVRSCTVRATCSGFINAASVLQMKGLECDGYAERINSAAVAVFEKITTLAELNPIFEMTSASNESTYTKKKRTLQEQLTTKQDPTCDKMQTQLTRCRNQEMFVTTRHMCHTFFFEHGKHSCEHVVHQKWLRKKKCQKRSVMDNFSRTNSLPITFLIVEENTPVKMLVASKTRSPVRKEARWTISLERIGCQ